MTSSVKPLRSSALRKCSLPMETAVRALKLGAFDFVSKPLDLVSLRKLVATAIKLSGSHDGSAYFAPSITSPGRSWPLSTFFT